MPKSMKNIICVLGIVSFISGCDNNDFLEKIGLKDKELTGEVFVVTNSGQSIKLGLVEVTALSEQKLATCINEKTRDWTEKYKKMYQEYTWAKEDSNLFGGFNPHLALYKQLAEGMKMGYIAYDYEKLNKSENAYKESIVKTVKRESNLNFLKKEYTLLKKGAFVMDCVKSDTVTKAISNADGQFSMKVPNEKIALFATSSRNIAGEVEDYYWLNWVDKDEKHVMLSNNNTYETLCPTCVVKLNGLPASLD